MSQPGGSPATPRGAMVSILGKIIVEVRSAPAVAAIVGDRVVGAEARSDWTPATSFVLIRRYGNVRRPRAAIMSGKLLIDCVGPVGPGGAQVATSLYAAVSDALSAIGPRRSAGGVAVFLTVEEIGGQQVEDPETGQPIERSIFAYSAPLAQAS